MTEPIQVNKTTEAIKTSTVSCKKPFHKNIEAEEGRA